MSTYRGPLYFPPGWSVLEYDQLDSTNAEAKRRAEDGFRGNLVISAEMQTAGRGRQGREWVSQATDNLYCSLLVHPHRPVQQVAGLALVIAVAAAEACIEVTFDELPLRLKWPNDLMLGKQKLGGILLEAESKGGGVVDWLVLGVGINVRTAPEGAASLASAHGGAVDPRRLMENLVRLYETWQARYYHDGLAPVRARWMELAYGLGAPMRARFGNRELFGVFDGLDADGACILRQEDGALVTVNAGEVFF